MQLPLLIAASLLALAQPLLAQQQQLVGASRCWDSLSPADTVRLAFAIHAEEHRIWRTSNPADLSTDYLTSVAEAIAARMSVPPRVESRAFTPHKGMDSTVELAVREIGASVTFKPSLDGRIGSVHLYGVGASPAWEQALAQAVVQADAAGEIPRLPPGSYSSDLTLEVSIGARVQTEDSPDSSLTAPPHPGASRQVPVGFAHVERYRLDQRATPIDRTQRVQFPGAGRAAAAGDSVALQFIIDESGKVEVDRVTLVTARYADFVTAIANALPKMRFEPARIGECRVRSVVSQAFVFRMSP